VLAFIYSFRVYLAVGLASLLSFVLPAITAASIQKDPSCVVNAVKS
jgi:hypothetical protein